MYLIRSKCPSENVFLQTVKGPLSKWTDNADEARPFKRKSDASQCITRNKLCGVVYKVNTQYKLLELVDFCRESNFTSKLCSRIISEIFKSSGNGGNSIWFAPSNEYSHESYLYVAKLLTRNGFDVRIIDDVEEIDTIALAIYLSPTSRAPFIKVSWA
jgi:hypothetical protein